MFYKVFKRPDYAQVNELFGNQKFKTDLCLSFRQQNSRTIYRREKYGIQLRAASICAEFSSTKFTVEAVQNYHWVVVTRPNMFFDQSSASDFSDYIGSIKLDGYL